MKDWLKPLLVYRKYLLAQEILKTSCNSNAIFYNEPHKKPLLTVMQYPDVFIASNFLRPEQKNDSNRIIESIDLLESNGHITTKRSSNLYDFSIKCTKEGERALNGGFYKSEAIKKEWKLITGIVLSLSGIILLIIKMVK